MNNTFCSKCHRIPSQCCCGSSNWIKNNEPVVWMNIHGQFNKKETWLFPIPLYTQDQLEEARKLGMQQERALWNLSESTQEIMNTHPADLTDEEIWDCHDKTNTNNWVIDFARAILRKAQEK